MAGEIIIIIFLVIIPFIITAIKYPFKTIGLSVGFVVGGIYGIERDFKYEMPLPILAIVCAIGGAFIGLIVGVLLRSIMKIRPSGHSTRQRYGTVEDKKDEDTLKQTEASKGQAYEDDLFKRIETSEKKMKPHKNTDRDELKENLKELWDLFMHL